MKSANPRPLKKFSDLNGYDKVILTGGEPMLDADRVINIATSIRFHSHCKIYLYTAYHKNDWDLERVLQQVDGIHYSLHAEATGVDIFDFECFQQRIQTWADVKSFRLFVDNKIKCAVHVRPNTWQQVEFKPWLSEAELLAKSQSMQSDLFILE